jgi:hypothetical protein
MDGPAALQPLPPPLPLRRMYDADEVDGYVDALRTRLAIVRAQLGWARDQPQGVDGECDLNEALVGRALLTAERIAEQMIAQAQTEATSLLATAREQADAVLAEAAERGRGRSRTVGRPRGRTDRQSFPPGADVTPLDPTAPWAAGPADDDYYAELRRALEDDYPLGPTPESAAPWASGRADDCYSALRHALAEYRPASSPAGPAHAPF